MKNLVIVGGGFAGFWSAMSAVRQARSLQKDTSLKITMVSLNEYLSLRPRFYENKFEEMRVPLRKYLDPLGIILIVGKVVRIDPKNKNVYWVGSKGDDGALAFDGLVLAAGSHLKRPSIPGFEHAFNVDTFENAVRLDCHLKELSNSRFSLTGSRTFVVVGASFTGLEVITGLPARIQSFALPNIDYKFILTDRSSSIASEYSVEGQEYIAEQLEKEGIQFLPEEETKWIDPEQIVFKSGRCIETRTIIWCGGMEASSLTKEFTTKRDSLGRLLVDAFLRIEDQKLFFAAGDVARGLVDEQHSSVMSCQHAMPQGKFAGHNAVNALFGKELVPYAQPRYGTCLDLGSEQALLTSGWERIPKMTGVSAKELKTEIVTQWIVPSVDVEETVKMSMPVILTND
ncbi:MAG: NAD(P)/FAD-dependent oxidoreductase [Leptospirillum sp.]|jgi:NADH dehydrogenase